MLKLDHRNARPIYEQVKDGLRDLVVTGAIGEGEKLPSVRALASSLAINPNTIQKAYEALEAEGYVSSVPGKGSFAVSRNDVQARRREALMPQWEGLTDELLFLGAPPEDLCARIQEKGGICCDQDQQRGQDL